MDIGRPYKPKLGQSRKFKNYVPNKESATIGLGTPHSVRLTTTSRSSSNGWRPASFPEKHLAMKMETLMVDVSPRKRSPSQNHSLKLPNLVTLLPSPTITTHLIPKLPFRHTISRRLPGCSRTLRPIPASHRIPRMTMRSIGILRCVSSTPPKISSLVATPLLRLAPISSSSRNSPPTPRPPFRSIPEPLMPSQ